MRGEKANSWEMRKKMKGKRIGNGKEKERRRGQNILKKYTVTVRKYKIRNREFKEL